jgi:hypothetical protein
VTEVRTEEEKKLGHTIPWSERPIARRRRRGGQPGHVALAYSLKVRARHERTGNSLLKIFCDSRSEERVKKRYYVGKRIYGYMRTIAELRGFT